MRRNGREREKDRKSECPVGQFSYDIPMAGSESTDAKRSDSVTQLESSDGQGFLWNNITLNVMDFNQEMSSSGLFAPFVTLRSICVIVFDASTSSGVSRVSGWLQLLKRTVASISPPQVLLVGITGSGVDNVTLKKAKASWFGEHKNVLSMSIVETQTGKGSEGFLNRAAESARNVRILTSGTSVLLLHRLMFLSRTTPLIHRLGFVKVHTYD